MEFLKCVVSKQTVLKKLLLVVAVLTACSSKTPIGSDVGHWNEQNNTEQEKPKLTPKEYQDQECQNFKQKLIKQGDWILNTIKRPEYALIPNNSSPKFTDVFYYHKKIDPNKTTVIFVNGGPGSDTHGSEKLLEIDKENKFNWVFFDQRGTGCSGYFPDVSDDMIDEQITDLAAEFSSVGLVEDMEHIRSIVNENRKWIVFGQSFGARVALRYAERYPKSLVGAIAHGASVYQKAEDRAVLRLTKANEVMRLFLEQNPEVKENYFKLRHTLPLDFCVGEYVKFCGTYISDVVADLLGFMHTWPFLVKSLKSLYDLDGNLNIEKLKEFLKKSEVDLPSATNITALDYIWSVERPVADMKCKYAYKRIRELGIDPTQFLVDECRSKSIDPSVDYAPPANMKNSKYVYDWSAFVKTVTHPDAPPVRTYFGKMDSYVVVPQNLEPYAIGTNKTHVFETSGHEGFRTESKIYEDMLALVMLSSADAAKQPSY